MTTLLQRMFNFIHTKRFCLFFPQEHVYNVFIHVKICQYGVRTRYLNPDRIFLH
jgi:hypothetical protein